MMTVMEIRTYEIQTDKLKRKERPLRIVMLSDLHDRLWGAQQKQLLDAVDRLCGDVVLCAGDMLTRGEHASMENTIVLFEGLSRRKAPVLASNGNHESKMRQKPEIYGRQYQNYAGRLRGLGVQILENEKYTMKFGSMTVNIYGYEMPLEYYRKFCMLPYDTEDLRQRFGTPEASVFHILLAHHPVYFKTYAQWGADLTLSGHLHGGIVRIPGIGGVITPQAKLFPKYDRGLFEDKGKYMAVSAGLGEHTVPIRIFNPPQLICIVVKGTGS